MRGFTEMGEGRMGALSMENPVFVSYVIAAAITTAPAAGLPIAIPDELASAF